MNIMIDIETMGQGNNAAIVALGAVAFDKEGIREEKFYEKIDLKEAAKYGDMDADAVLWWMKQSDEARAEITRQSKNTPAKVLLEFNKYLELLDEKHKLKIWGNGSDFDNVVLANLYKKIDISLPWVYWNSRCYRTIKSIYHDVKMGRVGTHHNAVDNAYSQAKHLLEIAKVHNISLI